MRNPQRTTIDKRSMPQKRHIWISLLGRHWIVRKRKPTLLGTAGAALGGLGVGALVWGNIRNFEPTRIGVALLIIGVMLICTKCLKAKNLAENEIFNLGRERGEADCYDEYYRQGLEDGRRERLTVVSMPQQCSCGDPQCLQPAGRKPVGSVADRG